jgi:hypothetical protein
MRRTGIAAVALIGLTSATACSDDFVTPDADTQLASVVPVGGAANVDPATSIVIEFSHPMMVGMEQYMTLSEGHVDGPLVAGVWTWSQDRTRATFQPASPLRAATRYTIHIGGGLMDENGRMIGFGDHGEQMGGQWATRQMMRGQSSMMGSGWQHSNGTFGMIFTFTTR